MIEVQNLIRHFGAVRAVDGISFKVPTGEVVGFLGPNGAGKTTTMRVITGFLAPTSGDVSVDNLSIKEHPMEIRRRLGYLPEDAPLYPEMEVVDYLDFVSRMRDIPPGERGKRIKTVIETAGLGDVVGRTIGTLSKGYRQRVGLAQAIIHNPDILILDEPTSGLDPNQIVEVREIIKKIGEEKTVVLSTHILPEVEATCKRAVIISDGKIVADGTLNEIMQTDSDSTSLFVEIKGASADEVKAFISELQGVRKVAVKEQEGDVVKLELTVSSDDDPRGVLFSKVVEKGWELLELRREALDLERIFRRLTIEGGEK